MDKVLMLWLEGPLQSWGDRSKFDVRGTLNFPTWSAVCGMICAALGKGGEQQELLAKLTRIPPRIFAFSLPQSVPAVLRDFQTAGSSFNENDPFELLMIPKKADGKKPTAVSGTVILHKHSIQDAFFAVQLPLEEELADTIYQAMLRPHWQLYLGRKAYTPADLIARGTFASFADADDLVEKIRIQKGLIPIFKVLPISDDNDVEGEQIELFDVPIRFGSHKQYQSRYAMIVNQE